MSKLSRAMLLTPPGPGAIAVIRVAGPHALAALERVFRPASPFSLAERLGSGRLAYGHILDGDEVIDDVIVAAAPGGMQSGADVSAHGGVRIVERILALLDREGVVPEAAPGNAVVAWPAANVIEREATRLLAEAKTQRCVRFLAWQREHLPTAVRRVIGDLELDSRVAAAALRSILAGARNASLLVEGATVALVGPPNGGKSTLFNRLVGREAAVVSPVAGTTRDWLSAEIEIGGIPITLFDTAGQRDAADELERLAIAAGAGAVANAAMYVVVVDATKVRGSELTDTARDFAPAGRTSIVALNKQDLMHRPAEEWANAPAEKAVPISASSGGGVARMMELVGRKLGDGPACDFLPAAFSNLLAKAIDGALEMIESRPGDAAGVLEGLIAPAGGG